MPLPTGKGKGHDPSDTDGTTHAIHHTLGPRRNQATSGLHQHKGGDSTLLFDGQVITDEDPGNLQQLLEILETYGLVNESTGGGSGGGSDVSSEYNFASAAYDWVIDHGFGTNLIEVSAFDSSGEIEYFPEIEYTTDDQVVIHWYYPTAGKARIVG